MKEIRKLLEQAKHFDLIRSEAQKNIKNIDVQYNARLNTASKNHEDKVKSLENERQNELNSADAHTKTVLREYADKKELLVKRENELKRWFDSSLLINYKASPTRLNDSEVTKLVSMLNEGGLLAWIKRTFKIGGYSSRSDMAYNACTLIEDAIAYYNERIDEIERDTAAKQSEIITRIRREIDEEDTKYKRLQSELSAQRTADRKSAFNEFESIESSAEMKQFDKKIKDMQAETANLYGNWGEYVFPKKMPGKFQLANAVISDPAENAGNKLYEVPIWVDAFKSNVIVVTSNRALSAPNDSEEKLFIRRFLAGILKTTPLRCVKYFIFDLINKGSSLERIIDVSNIATTDLLFNIITSNTRTDMKLLSADEARADLREYPAKINKYLGGRSETIFNFNKETGDFEYPFTWYIDFAFPEKLDEKDLAVMREIFINSSSAGYSFLLLTSNEGLECVKQLATLNPQICFTHIDIDGRYCESDGFRVNISDNCEPSPTQIYNFVTSLKDFYESGKSFDNRINKAFAANEFELRDATERISIPMALDNRGNLCDLQLGGDGSIHGFISGGTNSGKTTLLHTIITSACLHYSPADLELWLVDYKETEFITYKKSVLPHIKLIGLSKTADFTFSLLDRIIDEAARRTRLMKMYNAKDLESYRRHKGEAGYVHLTRLLIIIDEFHEMSQFVSDEPAYKTKLENILREYRSAGINLLLADQTFSSGLGGLTTPAKNQIGLRIAMRNDSSPMELKETLAVDRSLYTKNINEAIAVMRQGDFIMKTVKTDNRRTNDDGEPLSVRLEKMQALYTKEVDIVTVSAPLQAVYRGTYQNDLMYVNTDEEVVWNDSEPLELDNIEPIKKTDMRVYLGRPAVIRPCFGVDLGHKSDENIAIVGGSAMQRLSVLASIMQSCRLKGYNLIVFMAEYSDLMNDYESEIRSLCKSVPKAKLSVTLEEWCEELEELEKAVNSNDNSEDTICMFIGLETQIPEFDKLEQRGNSGTGQTVNAVLASLRQFGTPVGDFEDTALTADESDNAGKKATFNASPIIDKLFSNGSRKGIRCVAEVSVQRKYAKLLNLKNVCSHKIAFAMSSDDCMMFLGNGSYQKSIGENAVYNNGEKGVKKLVPYKLFN